jgi:hypothetical protein
MRQDTLWGAVFGTDVLNKTYHQSSKFGTVENLMMSARVKLMEAEIPTVRYLALNVPTSDNIFVDFL